MCLQPVAAFASLLLFGISICTAQNSTLKCGLHEKLLTCGSPCPPSCQDRAGCSRTTPCVNGCFCVNGYIREGPGGVCVKSCQNVPICNKTQHEEFTTCVSFTCPPGAFCPACRSGCKCVDGYALNNGQCVRASKPTKPSKPTGGGKCTGDHEKYKNYGSSCPATCSEPKKKCNNDVPTAGCFCQRWYIRDDSTQKCVRKRKCSTTPTTTTSTTTDSPIVQ